MEKELIKHCETIYVERRVPIELENEANDIIDEWLKSKGFDPDAI